MTGTAEGRGTRPVFFVVLGVALLGAALAWFLNRPSAPEFAAVSGVVTLDGKPLGRVEVRFQPDPEKGARGPVSSCYTDEAGRYTIRCDRFNQDGAVPGVHRVVIFDITALPDLDAAGAGSRGGPPKASRIPGKYESVSTTPFDGVEVKPGTQEVNFNLVSKAR